MTPTFRLKNAALLMALAAAYPLQAQAAAGITQFSVGDVTLRRGAGADPLTKGRNLESGDAITTGPDGRAQIRFSDGGLVALQPNSQFNITRYNDAGDAKQDGFFVDLLRGGMRAVTGLIGKRNHDNYRVTTQTATVGIRGSAFNIAYNDDGTLSVATEMDEIVVCTQGGCVGLTAGEAVRVRSNTEVPSRVNERTSMPTPAPRQEPQVAGNQTSPTGTPAIVPVPVAQAPRPPAPPAPTPPAPTPPAPNPPTPAPPAPTPPPAPTTVVIPGAALAIVGNRNNDGTVSVDQRNYANGAIAADLAGNLNSYTSSTGAVGERVGGGKQIARTGTLTGGDYMVIGTLEGVRWTEGGVVTNVGNSAFAGGFATPAAALRGDSIKGMRGTYAMTSATPVFASNGTTGTLDSARLTVDFLGVGSYINSEFQVTLPGGTGVPRLTKPGSSFQVVSTEGGTTSAAATTYSLAGNGTGTGSGFSGALSVYSEACAYGYAICGGGSFSGFFGGPAGAGAGLTFSASSSDHGNFGGAALLALQGAREQTPVTSYTNGDGPSPVRAVFIDGAIKNRSYAQISPTSFYGNDSIGSVNFAFTGAQLTGWSSTGNGDHAADSVSLYSSGSSFGAFGTIDSNNFIGWGTWASAKTGASGYGAYGGQGSTSQLLDTVHYVVGTPTPNMPLYGTAAYTLLGGSAPTATSYNSASGLTTTVSGQLLANSNLSVDFGASNVNANIYTAFNGVAQNVISANVPINGAAFAGQQDSVTINGLFTGNNAYRAGLVYGAGYPAGSAIGHITGAAVFQRTGSPTGGN